MAQSVFVKTRLQQRRGKAAQWHLINPVLLDGEIGIENETRSFKIGDGVTAWNDLPYFGYIVPASASKLGGVIAETRNAGDTVEVRIDATTYRLYVPGYPVLPTLAAVASSGNYNDLAGRPEIPPPYTLPAASDTTLGGIKIGGGLTADSGGRLSVTSTDNNDLGVAAILARTSINLNGIFTKVGQRKTYYFYTSTKYDTVSFTLSQGSLYSPNGQPTPPELPTTNYTIIVVNLHCVRYDNTDRSAQVVMKWEVYTVLN